MNNFGFGVLSVSDCGRQRKALARNSKEYLYKFFTDLNIKTVRITSKEDMDLAIKENQSLALIKFSRSETLNCWGQIGIIASTYLACNELLKSSLDGILLVEDDVVLKKGFVEAFRGNISQINDDWDLFFQFRPDWLLGANEEFESQPSICSLGAYAISRSGASKLIADCVRKIEEPLDLHYFMSSSKFVRYAVGRGSKMFCRLDENASLKSTITRTQKI